MLAADRSCTREGEGDVCSRTEEGKPGLWNSPMFLLIFDAE